MHSKRQGYFGEHGKAIWKLTTSGGSSILKSVCALRITTIGSNMKLKGLMVLSLKNVASVLSSGWWCINFAHAIKELTVKNLISCGNGDMVVAIWSWWVYLDGIAAAGIEENNSSSTTTLNWSWRACVGIGILQAASPKETLSWVAFAGASV